jgi:plastocyanin
MRIARLGSVTLLLVAVVALVLVGCSSGGSTGGGSAAPAGGSAAPAGGTVVVMKNFAFDNASPSMKVGESITFKNDDSAPHDIKIDGQDSGVIAPGKSWSLKIDKAGNFPFSCTIHPSMTGALTVQ